MTKFDSIFAKVTRTAECRVAIADLIESGIMTDEAASYTCISMAISAGWNFKLTDPELREVWYRLLDYYVEGVANTMHDNGDLTYEERDQAISERKLKKPVNTNETQNQTTGVTTMNNKKSNAKSNIHLRK